MFLKRFISSTLLAIMLMVGCFLWMQSNYSLVIEDTFLKWQMRTKRLTFLNDMDKGQLAVSDIVFIDVSNLRTAEPSLDNFGNDIVVDQNRLHQLLGVLEMPESNPLFVICDVLIDKDRNIEGALLETGKKFNNIIFPYTLENGSYVGPPQGSLPVGYVGYTISSGLLLSSVLIKYQYWPDLERKGLPLTVVEKVFPKIAHKSVFGLIKIDQRFYLNSIYLDFQIHNHPEDEDIASKRSYPAEVIIDYYSRVKSDKQAANFFNGKIVIIGDLKNDVHNTVFGSLPGPVIIANLLLTIYNQDNKVALLWISYILVNLITLSWYFLYPREFATFRFFDNLSRSPLRNIFSNPVIYLAYIYLMSLISLVFFAKPLPVVGLLLLVGVIESIKDLRSWWINNRTEIRRSGWNATLLKLFKPT